MNQKKKGVFLPLILCLCLAVAVGAVCLMKNTGEPVPTAVPETTAPKDEVLENGVRYRRKQSIEVVYILGLDKFETQIKHAGYLNDQQADFNLLVVIDQNAGTCKAIHLNRDTMCAVTQLGAIGDVVGKKTAQLALAHTYGSGGSDSCINARKAVSELLGGEKIDYYVSLSMDAVPIINDAAGGVTLECMDDLTSYDPAMTKGTTLTLWGDQALFYVRARKNAGDQSNLRRMERQRQYMLELWRQVSVKAEKDQNFLTKLVLDLSGKLQTDYPNSRMEDLFRAIGGLSLDEIITIDGEAVKGEEFMEFYPDAESLRQAVLELFYEPVQP